MSEIEAKEQNKENNEEVIEEEIKEVKNEEKNEVLKEVDKAENNEANKEANKETQQVVNKTKIIITTVIWIAIFIVYTIIIKTVDVAPVGPEGSYVGLATINKAAHDYFGINLVFYELSDYLVKFSIVVAFALVSIGLVQWIKNKSFKSIDKDIHILFWFYAFVVGMYGVFEILEINYRPIIMDEGLESSYPSSHTMVMLCIMIPAMMQFARRIKNKKLLFVANVISMAMMFITVVARFLSGVHWLTDIVGGILVSVALVRVYYTFEKLV